MQEKSADPLDVVVGCLLSEGNNIGPESACFGAFGTISCLMFKICLPKTASL